MRIVKFKSIYYKQVNNIYKSSFLPEERYISLNKMIKRKEDADDYITRKRRLDFYLRNNFFITNYISKEDKENFNILSNCEEINIDEYKKLDKFVADILEEPVSDIMERDNRIS